MSNTISIRVLGEEPLLTLATVDEVWAGVERAADLMLVGDAFPPGAKDTEMDRVHVMECEEMGYQRPLYLMDRVLLKNKGGLPPTHEVIVQSNRGKKTGYFTKVGEGLPALWESDVARKDRLKREKEAIKATEKTK